MNKLYVFVQANKGKTLFNANAPRHFHLIAGDEAFAWQQVQYLLPPHTLCCVVSSRSIPCAIPAKKAHTCLGQEFDYVIFDAFSGLDVNAFAAVCGTVRAGGAVYMLAPPLERWASYPDPAYQRFLPYPYTTDAVAGLFIQRFIRISQNDMSVLSSVVPPVDAVTQADAVTQIVQVRGPIVLTADRGRGKSAALGLAATHLIQQGLKVGVTAPNKASLWSVFKHAEQAPIFYAPDVLLATLPPLDVLMVDEAAAIPIPLLLKMVEQYPRCIFSTTVHGYEGSGRGFVLRFQAELQALVGDVVALRLFQPMRWALNDPLESFVNRVLLLNTEVRHRLNLRCLNPRYAQLMQANLSVDEPLLQQVFGLLVNAHYQTRPSDLQQLLDAPNVSVHVLMQSGIVLAVALLSHEGGLDASLTSNIYEGKRRPHGHLVPQTLTYHAQIAGAAELRCERIMRIAVLPALQGKGLGRYFMQQLIAYSQQRADYMGVSYALTPELKHFWEMQGFTLARVGHRRDTASGNYSAVHVYPFTERAKVSLVTAPAHQPRVCRQ